MQKSVWKSVCRESVEGSVSRRKWKSVCREEGEAVGVEESVC